MKLVLIISLFIINGFLIPNVGDKTTLDIEPASEQYQTSAIMDINMDFTRDSDEGWRYVEYFVVKVNRNLKTIYFKTDIKH